MEKNFGGVIEKVVTVAEYPVERSKLFLANDTIVGLGYGKQLPAQALNMRDNGINIIIGQRAAYSKKGEEPTNWERARSDKWEPGVNLFSSLEEAAEKGTIVLYLLSDAGQKQKWNDIRPCLKEGNALYFSHGFSIVYKNQTGVIPPDNIDVIMVAPKGAGSSVRSNFLEKKGINSSYAIHQDYTGRAEERTIALGIAIGSGYLYPTTFEHEVWSDLTGERGVLMGAIAGIMKAQYDELRRRGHSPSEAFNETVEEATQSLYPLIGQNGMDWMFSNCSTTAQVGALNWLSRFEEAVKPVFQELYDRVKSGKETEIVLKANSDPNYRANLDERLKRMRDSEMWQAGKAVRSLRPENQKK